MQRSARPEQPLTIKRIANLHAPLPPSAKGSDDSLSQVTNAEDDTRQALPTQLLELMHSKRLAGHVDHHLGQIGGERPQPGSQAARQNRHRQAHPNNTLVPSKSKRKRTSSRPACAMASRRRRRSSA